MCVLLFHSTQASANRTAQDEIGKGSATIDGASILAALVNWATASASPPRLLISTHFSLSTPAGVLRRPEAISALHMESVASDATRTFSYEVKAGAGDGESYGIDCAARARIPDAILQRAALHLDRANPPPPLHLTQLVNMVDFARDARERLAAKGSALDVDALRPPWE